MRAPARSRDVVARPRDRRAREVERMAARVEDDLDDVRRSRSRRGCRSRARAVLITQSVRSASSAAQASISAGSISGSSPCTLTTISSSPRPSSSARLGDAVAAGGVAGARQQRGDAVCGARGDDLGVVGGDDDARRAATPLRAGRRGRSSARRRCRRAPCAAGASRRGGPGSRTTNGTRQSRTLAAGGVGAGLAAERARLAFEHHRNAVADREGQPVGIADELLAIVLRRPPMLQRALAERADQQVKQARFHAGRSVRRRRQQRQQRRVEAGLRNEV